MLTFQAALDSDGIGNEISVFIVEQKDTNGVSVQNHTADKDRSNSQIFFVTFPSAGGSLTGTYSACKCSTHTDTHINMHMLLQIFLSSPIIRLQSVSM